MILDQPIELPGENLQISGLLKSCFGSCVFQNCHRVGGFFCLVSYVIVIVRHPTGFDRWNGGTGFGTSAIGVEFATHPRNSFNAIM